MEGHTGNTYLIAPNVDSTQLHSFLLIPLATVLLATGVAVFKWRFPCTTVEALEKKGESTNNLLTKALQEDLLGEMEDQLRQAWRGHRDKVEEIGIKAIEEPDSRRHPIAWIRFHWRQLRDIDVCYTGLQELSVSITSKCEKEKKNRRYFTPADASAYSSSVYTPNAVNPFQVAVNQE